MQLKVKRFEVVYEICIGPEGYEIHRDGVVIAQGIADIEAARAEVDCMIERWDPTGSASGREDRRSIRLP